MIDLNTLPKTGEQLLDKWIEEYWNLGKSGQPEPAGLSDPSHADRQKMLCHEAFIAGRSLFYARAAHACLEIHIDHQAGRCAGCGVCDNG